MANLTKSGVIFDPSTGSGNTQQTAKLSAANLGNRVAVPVSVTYTSPGATSKTIEYQIEAAEEFCKFDDGASMAVSKTGGTVNIYGTSNSKKLIFATGSGTLPLTLAASGAFKIKGASDADYRNATSGTNISGDPGASASYKFWVQFNNVPANTSLAELTNTLTVTTDGSQTATISLVQAAGDAYINVTPTTTVIPQDGSAITVQIECNGSWSCS